MRFVVSLIIGASLPVVIAESLVLWLWLRTRPVERRPYLMAMTWLGFAVAACLTVVLLSGGSGKSFDVGSSLVSLANAAVGALFFGGFPAATAWATSPGRWPRTFGIAIAAAGIGTVLGFGMTVGVALIFGFASGSDFMTSQRLVQFFPMTYAVCAAATTIVVWRGSPDRPAEPDDVPSAAGDRSLTRGMTVAFGACVLAAIVTFTGRAPVSYSFGRTVFGHLTVLATAGLMAVAAFEMLRHRRRALGYAAAALLLPMAIAVTIGETPRLHGLLIPAAVIAILANWRSLR